MGIIIDTIIDTIIDAIIDSYEGGDDIWAYGDKVRTTINDRVKTWI